MVYFIADTHFGHANVIDLSKRPFRNIYSMDEAIIDNWNARVNESDTVYILGDFAYRSKLGGAHYASRLNGRKHLIVGNHDRDDLKKADFRSSFVSIEKLTLIQHDGKQIVLCHYPILEWHGFYRGFYHMHGHIHNSMDATGRFVAQQPRMLNVGVDIVSFTPVTFKEAITANQVFYNRT